MTCRLGGWARCSEHDQRGFGRTGSLSTAGMGPAWELAETTLQIQEAQQETQTKGLMLSTGARTAGCFFRPLEGRLNSARLFLRNSPRGKGCQRP